MKEFNQAEFDRFILDSGIIGFFKEPVKFKSGRLCNCYVNWRTAAEDAYLLDQLADFVMSFVISHKLSVDTFYGVPEGATKLGILTQYKWARSQSNFALGSHVLSMGRGKIKDHGDPKDKSFLASPKGKTIVLEDVTSTGGSLIEAVAKLQGLNVNVVAAIALTNRNEYNDERKKVDEILKSKGVPYFAMSNLLTLLPQLCTTQKQNPQIIGAIEEYFKKYGTQPLSL